MSDPDTFRVTSERQNGSHATRGEPMNAKDILLVTRAWARNDDWGCLTIYVNILEELMADLAAGDDPAMLADLATHTGLTYTAAQRRLAPRYVTRNTRRG